MDDRRPTQVLSLLNFLQSHSPSKCELFDVKLETEQEIVILQLKKAMKFTSSAVQITLRHLCSVRGLVC